MNRFNGLLFSGAATALLAGCGGLPAPCQEYLTLLKAGDAPQYAAEQKSIEAACKESSSACETVCKPKRDAATEVIKNGGDIADVVSPEDLCRRTAKPYCEIALRCAPEPSRSQILAATGGSPEACASVFSAQCGNPQVQEALKFPCPAGKTLKTRQFYTCLDQVAKLSCDNLSTVPSSGTLFAAAACQSVCQ